MRSPKDLLGLGHPAQGDHREWSPMKRNLACKELVVDKKVSKNLKKGITTWDWRSVAKYAATLNVLSFAIENFAIKEKYRIACILGDKETREISTFPTSLLSNESFVTIFPEGCSKI